MLFSIPLGEGAEAVPYQESDLGPELDEAPGRFVFGPDGGAWLLSPGASPALVHRAAAGGTLGRVDLRLALPGVEADDLVELLDLFAAQDHVSVLLLVTLRVEQRAETWRIDVDNAETVVARVRYPELVRSFPAMYDLRFRDREGFLYARVDGGGCEIYAPTGERVRSLDQDPALVDEDGRLYVIGEALRIFDREGALIERVELGDPAPIGFALRREDTLLEVVLTDTEEDPTTMSLRRTLRTWRKEGATLRLVDERELSASRFRVLETGSDAAVPLAVYADRLVLAPDGGVYELGRDATQVWVAKVEL